ncbi:MAG: NPCBM/NEW2 domain-containing protein [Paeniclostridium sordellii]|nr:NPCBM/NEW2 domain-containing protein [Paeniclostridium sordellii]
MRKKISAVLAMSIIATNVSPAINVYANEVVKEKAVSIEKQVSKNMTVTDFKIKNNPNFAKYNELYRVGVQSISNNGRSYPGTKIENAIDGKLETHWETYTKNDETFKNEVTVEFKDIAEINRLAYATRQDGAKGKGYPTSAEIYVSESETGEDFKLAGKVEGSKATGGMVEFKFDTVRAKRVKFKFVEAHNEWASAAEFWFYKEDKTLDKMERLFTDSNMNKVSEEFANTEALNTLEKETEGHPFHESFKEYINNARIVLQNNGVNFTETRVSKLIAYGTDKQQAYDEKFRLGNEHIAKTEVNGGNYPGSKIEYMYDGNPNTHWETNRANSNEFTNEVTFTFDEIRNLDRIALLPRSVNQKGFPTKYEIYASETSQGNTFKLVSKGTAKVTGDFMQFKFNPTSFKRLKFVFKECHQNRAFISEARFYKQDAVSEKMETLFTDANKNTVNPDFVSLDKLKALEEEAKKHPLYSEYKEDLEDAKQVIEGNNVEFTEAKVSKFKDFGSPELVEYDKLYKIDKSHIKKITTNGSHWADNTIDKAIDGNPETNWHSDDRNSDNHTNEVIMTLDQIRTLDRIMYYSPRDRGFAEKFDIYTSKTSTGDTFTKVTSGSASRTNDVLSIKFNPTQAKRIKFVFKQSYEGWALASEFGLYKEDKTLNKVDDLFTNELKNELKPEYNNLKAIEELEKEVKVHPLKADLMENIDIAKELISNPENVKGRIFEVESRGDAVKESQKRKVWNFRDWQPTGLAVKSGEKITVYVDTEPGEPVPNLVYKQMDSKHNGLRDIKLTRGKNEIVIPEVEANDVRPGTAIAGVLYVSNPYTPDQQSRKPKIRIIGGVNYPQYVEGVTTDEQVMKELREYTEKLKADTKLPDVFEVVSNKALINVKATYALKWYTDNNKVPSYTAKKSDEVIAETMKLWGFDGSKEVHSDFNFRYVSMIKNLSGGAFMNAGNGITGFNYNEQGGALNVDTGWGFMHEMGHNFDTGNRSIAEVTNNILPLHFQMIKGEPSKISEQNLWERNILPKVSKEDYSNNEWYPENDRSLLSHMAPLWQLQIYDNTFWPRFEQQFRERNIGGGDWNDKHEAWAVVASDVLQLDLTEHFARHGFRVNEATKKHMSQYKKPDKKLWYINDNKYLKKGEGFNNELDCNLKVKTQENSVKLDIAIDKANENSLLGYEIVRDGKVIGFTTKDTFTDTNINSGTNHEYKVIPYDVNINPAEGVSVKAHQPSIETVGGVTLGLREKFNPLDYVKATDYQGNKISDVKFTSNVDTERSGNYTVTYEVTADGATTREIMNVDVVSKYDYLSDREWNSHHTDWGTPSRNNSIKGRTLGEIKNYDKGIRLHANGNVVYDLGEHNYDNFEVKVGVDMNIEAQNNSSITFKIVGDGKTLATTKVLKHADNMQYINVPVKGVKELRLEVNNGGNGNTSDHGIFVEPKLTTNNAKPELTIPKSQTVKIGQTLEDVVGTYKAIDAEDGDITGNVVVTGQDKVNFNRVGNYTITYSITDKDGNKTEKSRVISVVNPEDFRYLSDYEWKSATKGWGTIGIDKSIDKREITLTGEDNQPVVYKKGIGTHAHSEIVYDLTDKNVNMFSSFVGIDREMYNGPASVEFKVYVDDDLAYDSGVMRARDAQKFVQVDLAGAKELKLVATNGGDGIGSDHADWADAKLYFVNNDRVDKSDLTKTIEDAKKIEKDNYTEGSVKALENKIAEAEALLKEEKPSQEAIDNMTSALQEAVKALVEINLEEVVSIPDKYLVKSLSSTLGKEGNFTVGDMRKLTKLDIGYGVESLEGLQHAKNLESIVGERNEVRDLRPLSGLTKLKEVNFREQYVAVGELTVVDGKLKVNTEAYNRQGKNITTKVSLVAKDGTIVKEQGLDGTTKEVDLDVSGVEPGYYGVHVAYEDSEISGILIYMTGIK